MPSPNVTNIPNGKIAFQILARALITKESYSPRAVVILDFCGKALGIAPEDRRILAKKPALRMPLLPDLIDLISPFITDPCEEIRNDFSELLESHLHLNSIPAQPAPLCPFCKSKRSDLCRLLWRPPEESGLDPIEGTERSIWHCSQCAAILLCIDELEGERRSRHIQALHPGREVKHFLKELQESEGDPSKVVSLLNQWNSYPWILTCLAPAKVAIESALGAIRSRILANPESADASYRHSSSLARLGPPKTPEAWNHILRSDPDPSVLAAMASLPGAPLSCRKALCEHSDPEVRYQALQAPDIPYSLLEEQLCSGPISSVLAILDRPDVGHHTLHLALTRNDPHIAYRVSRHSSLDLILLEQIRKFRHADLKSAFTSSRTLQVYGPLEGEADLLAALFQEIESNISKFGWRLQRETSGPKPDQALSLEAVRVTQSRAILSVKEEDLRGFGNDLKRERLLEDLAHCLLETLAREIIALHVDEELGFWEGRILRPQEQVQRSAGHGLNPKEDNSESGRWLEFELFCAERALPIPGIPLSERIPRLETRPPYAKANQNLEERSFVWLIPDF